MPLWMYFLASYGIAFGLQNDKATWLTDPLKELPLWVDEDGRTFFRRMLSCVYCVGFHTGWMTWLVHMFVDGPPIPLWDDSLMMDIASLPCGLVSNFFTIPLWCFCSSTVCYSLDLFVLRWLEPEPDPEE